MDKYVADIEVVNQAESRIRMNKSARKWRGRKVFDAGMAFLGRIHQEIDDKQPQWVKDQRQKELDELAGKVEDDSPYVPPPLPADQLPAE